jgi:hypothetical protein
MRLSFYIIGLLVFIVSCNNKPKQHAPTDKVYHLGFHVPTVDTSQYYYTITNKTQTDIEANGKIIHSTNTTTTGLLYTLVKDKSDTIQLTITYKSLQAYSNKDGVEKNMDAANAANSINPVEKLLGSLIGASVYVRLSPKGKVLAITGNEALKNKLLQSLNMTDTYMQAAVQQQLSQILGENFVTANLEQTINVLPDSALYVGDSWQTNSKQQGQMALALTNTYTLDAVENGRAKLSLVSTVNSDSSTNKIMGYDVASTLKGKQKGHFEIDQATGLVMNSTNTSTIDGSIQLMGKDIPITITTNKTLVGKKL